MNFGVEVELIELNFGIEIELDKFNFLIKIDIDHELIVRSTTFSIISRRIPRNFLIFFNFLILILLKNVVKRTKELGNKRFYFT